MKKLLWFNIFTVILFILLDPLLARCTEWAVSYNLGAELLIGTASPIILILFMTAMLFSCAYSLFRCIRSADIKLLLPITVFAVGAAVYYLFYKGLGFWTEIVNYYITAASR